MSTATCKTCGRGLDDPYRFYRDGKIIAGCVAACHTAHLVRPSASAAWHDRLEARKIRYRRDDELFGNTMPEYPEICPTKQRLP